MKGVFLTGTHIFVYVNGQMSVFTEHQESSYSKYEGIGWAG